MSDFHDLLYACTTFIKHLPTCGLATRWAFAEILLLGTISRHCQLSASQKDTTPFLWISNSLLILQQSPTSSTMQWWFISFWNPRSFCQLSNWWELHACGAALTTSCIQLISTESERNRIRIPSVPVGTQFSFSEAGNPSGNKKVLIHEENA